MTDLAPDDGLEVEPSAEALEDTEQLVARAIESVLDQVPDLPDASIPEASGRAQPWADNAAPPGSKRPLEALLEDFAARIAAEPEAVVQLPNDKRPAVAFFERFEKGADRPGSGSGRKRRRRGRGGGVATGSAPGVPSERRDGNQGGRPGGGRGRGRGRARGQGEGKTDARAAGSVPTGPPAGSSADAGEGAARKRRRRRGRGRGRGPGGAPGGAAPGGPPAAPA